MQLSITYSAGKWIEPSTYSHMSDVGVVEIVGLCAGTIELRTANTEFMKFIRCVRKIG